MKIRRTLIAAAAAAALFVSVTACSSSSSTSGSTSTTVSTSGDQVTDTECPFTGTVGTTSGGKSGVSSALASIVNSKQGCVDSIQLNLGSVGSWSVAYATGPVVDGSGATVSTQGTATLVVTLAPGSWTGSPAAPTTVPPVQLDYVESINVVSGPNNSLLVVFGLSSKKPYQASDSQTPAYISLGIG